MKLRRDGNVKEIVSILEELRRDIEALGKLNLNDTSIHAEMAFLNVLNATYGWKLRNANKENVNMPAIDLIDVENKLVVQVSATCSRQKVVGTLGKKSLKRYASQGYHLKFMFVGKQTRGIKDGNYSNVPPGLVFEPHDDILLIEDLEREIEYEEDPAVQENILEVLRKETGKDFCLDRSKIHGFLERQIAKLGARYTPELSLDTDLGKRLYAVSMPQDLIDDVSEKATPIANKMSRILRGLAASEEATSTFSPLLPELEDICDHLRSIADCKSNDGFLSEIVSIQDFVTQQFINLVVPNKESEGKGTRALREDISTAIDQIRSLYIFCSSKGVFEMGKRCFLITGEAGSGKSHAVADFLKGYVSVGGVGLLFLGNEFLHGEDVVDQLVKQSGFDCGRDDILSEASRLASTTSDRPAIVVVDALNEGEGPLLWQNQINRLIEATAKFDNVKLILTARSSSVDDIIPAPLKRSDFLSQMECNGFEGDEDYALRAFCNYYGLAFPSFPPLSWEFSNPLYLKLLCEYLKASGKRGIERDYSFTDITDHYLDEIDRRVEQTLRPDGYPCVGLVKDAVWAIVTSTDYNGYSITYKKAIKVVAEAVTGFYANPSKLMGQLVSENLFNVFGHGGEAELYFAYQRVGEVYYWQARLAGFSREDPDLIESLRVSIQPLLQRAWSWDAVQTLSVVLPEMLDVEAFQILDVESDHERAELASCFVEGLPWRHSPVLSAEVRRYINTDVLHFQIAFEGFIGALIDLSYEEENPYNAILLDKMFRGWSTASRDAEWTFLISTSRADACMQISEWCWRNADKLSDVAASLVSIFLCWTCSSTCPVLRDTATKALTATVIAHPGIAAGLWERFKDIGDDYILERLIAMLFGAYCHVPEALSWPAIASGIYELVFCGEETYPNILVRDYARSMIKRMVRRGTIEEEPFKKAFERGHSSWYEHVPSNEEIDEFENKVKKEYGEHSDEANSVRRIIHSMTTEYGRGTCAYGDFGRYVFGIHVDMWDNQFNSDQDLANIVTDRVLNGCYSVEKHSRFDAYVLKHQNGMVFHAERIGKKYQRVETRRILARLVDNYPPYREVTKYSDEYERLISSSGDKLFSHFRNKKPMEPLSVQEEDARQHPEKYVIATWHEPIPDDEIANELIGVRDIDPTWILPPNMHSAQSPKESGGRCLLAGSDAGPRLLPQISLPEPEMVDQWIGSDESPEISDAHEVHVDGRSYVVLYCSIDEKRTVSDAREKGATRTHGGWNDSRLVWLSGGAFVPEKKIGWFRDYHAQRHGNGVPVGELKGWYFMDNFESDAFKYEASLAERESIEEERLVLPATFEYSWSHEGDKSIEDGTCINIPMLCPELVRYFRLRIDASGTWKTPEGLLVAFATRLQGYPEDALLFDAELLRDFLLSKGLVLVWGEYWEKIHLDHRVEAWQSVVKNDDEKNDVTVDDICSDDLSPIFE